jgi:hypothetical protein
MPDLDAYLDEEEEGDVSTINAFTSEDEDENPVDSGIIQAGWKAAKEAMTSNKTFTQDFRFSEDTQIVKFLESAPYATYKQHWVQERAGQKSFVCLGPTCPLCRIAGHKPDNKIAFSILNLTSEGEPEVQALVVGSRLASQLDSLNNDTKVGPLDSAFWALSKSGPPRQPSYSILPVKARDLADDWDIDHDAVMRLLAEVEPMKASSIRVASKDTLTEIAHEIAS